MDKIMSNRVFMKSNFQELDEIMTDQQQQLPQPPLCKPYDKNGTIIDLPLPNEVSMTKSEIYDCMKSRRSVRSYSQDAISMQQLSFLLWSTQGIDKIKNNNYATLRPVPSGGARHPFETYLAIFNVEGLKKGMYRYLPIEHKLLLMYEDEVISEKVISATADQKFAGRGAVTFIWSCIPYRSEWRYSFSAHKTMLLDAGHVCQNLYLACTAIGCGTCAIAAYDQNLSDQLIGVDGQDEFSIYISPVGKLQR